MRDMMAELNGLIARQESGEDVQEAFEAFKDRYDDMIPGDPETLEELLEEMARRMAAMNRLLAGMTPEQRQQLAELAAQMLGDAADRYHCLAVGELDAWWVRSVCPVWSKRVRER